MKTIGWKETFDLPELGIFGITAKIDTGAASSVLHCDNVSFCFIEGKKHIQFSLNFNQEHKEFCLPIFKEKMVKSSFGQTEKREFIKTKIVLFGNEFDIILSFRDRSAMNFPMLLGRNFIHKKFIIDVSKSNLSMKSS